MNHTQHYQLSQWDGADRVLRQDFNGDNAKIDAALAALQGGIDGARSDAASAVSQARTDLTAAVNTAKSDLTSALNSAKSSLQSSITGLQNSRAERVTILDTTFTASGSSHSFSISGSLLGGCLLAVFDFQSTGSGSSVYLSLSAAGEGSLWTAGRSSPETGSGVALLSPGYLNRFICFPMKDTSAKFALMSLGTTGVQQGWGSTAYSSLRTLYLRGSVSGQWKVKVIGLR